MAFNPIHFYESGKAKSQFVSTWKTNNLSSGSSTATQVKLPLVSTGTYNFIVDWGDGTSNNITTWNATATTHTYATAGTYTIKIKGVCTGWRFANTGDRLKILSVTSWGKLKLGTTETNHFYGCANLNLSGVTDILDLTGTTVLEGCFWACSSLTTIGRLNEWNTSGVTNMSSIFKFATLFNQNIGSWNTASVTSMRAMFESCTNFNNGLASGVAGTLSWNTAAVTDMTYLFLSARSFNCNVGSWNVSNVTSFNSTFNDAWKFNNGGSPDINNWAIKTTGTVNMSGMFQQTTIFNQPLDNWNTIAVTIMSTMFYAAPAFNNGLASGVAGALPWNTANVTTMWWMFNGASSFNCNVGSWNVSLVSDFSGMFYGASKFNNGGSNTINNWVFKTTGTILMVDMFRSAVLFNQPLNSWNTQAVTSMANMFNNANVFNNGLASGTAGTLAWNTSAVTTMASMFQSAASFNCNVGSWNVSAVTNFEYTFYLASKFNNGGSADINTWTIKTTGTISMYGMFQSATIFNQNIGSWNTIAVTNMGYMFFSATAFNQNLGSWNVSAVTNFGGMFRNATNFNNAGNSTIDNWVLKTSSTVAINEMFMNATNFNQPLNSWNTQAVTNMSLMFSSATKFNNGLASGTTGTLVWNTAAVTNMNSMFSSTAAFDCNIGSWNVSAVTNFGGMFSNATKFNNGGSGDINNWTLKTTGPIDMNQMFSSNPAFNQSISSWNTVAVTNMQNMFRGSAFNNGLGVGVAGTLPWNTSAVTNMTAMFYGTSAFNCSLDTFNMSNVATMNAMFMQASKFNNGGSTGISSWTLKTTGTVNANSMFHSATLFNQPLDGWNTVAITDMASMFFGAPAFNNGLASGTAGTLTWNTIAVTTMIDMFSSAASFNCNIGGWNVSVVTTFRAMFMNATKFNNGGSDTIGNWTLKTTGPVDMTQMFQNATIFNQPLNGWNTIAVTTMGSMFYLATAFNNGLTSGTAGTLSWNTAAVTTMSSMFQSAVSFNCNIGSWNVSAVTTFAAMFSTATKFNNGGSDTIGTWVLKTTGTVNMSYMFQTTTIFNQPLNGWNTQAVTNMQEMFSNSVAFNNGLTSGTAGTLAWNTAAVTNMISMFNQATSFNQNIGSWNVSAVTTFASMFSSATKFNNGGSGDINNWTLKTTGTINMDYMFQIATIFNQPLNSWNTVAVTSMAGLFINASAFNQPLNSWNTTNVTNMVTIFRGANAFNQNIGSWNVSKVTSFSGFMDTKTPLTFSTTNLDAIYNGWSTRPVLASKSISFGTAKRTATSTAGRAILTGSPNIWTITDGGI